MNRRIALLFASLFFLLAARAQDQVNFTYSIQPGLNVIFANTSVVGTDMPRKAFWDFGDGIRQQTPPLAGIQHHYNAAGSYTACLRIYRYPPNSNDSFLTGTMCKVMNLQPMTDSCHAQFSFSPAGPAHPLLFNFVAQPWHSNPNKKPEEICWHFGDVPDTCLHYNPLNANTYNISHTFAHPGTYLVCATIRYQGGCVSHECHTVQVGAVPVPDSCKADFTLQPVTASPLSRGFTAVPWHNLQKKPVRVCWYYGDGADTCILYPVSYTGPYTTTHTYPGPGQYNMCVKILYDGGCETMKCHLETVSIPNPGDTTCTVDLNEGPVSANGIERHFNALPMPNRVPVKVCWYYGDGTDTCINLANPATAASLQTAHHYPGPGVYHICVKMWYANGCVAQKCREIHIPGPNNLCGGYMSDSVVGVRTLRFRAFPIMNPNDHVISYTWTFGDGSSASGQNVTHTYLAGGNFEVCVTIRTDLGCVTKICRHVVVNGPSTSQLQLAPNPVHTNLTAVFQSAITETVTISIYNSNGVQVRNYVRNAVAGGNTWVFDVSTLQAGIYSVVVGSPTQFATATFIRQ
jgi:PKD repeat protein